MRRNGAPEVVPCDIEGGELSGKLTSLQRVAPPIIPFQMPAHAGKTPAIGSYSRRGANTDGNSEGLKNTMVMVGGIWIFGWLILGYDFLWPLYLVLNLLSGFLNFPPFSWIFGWLYRGVPLLSGGALVDEAQLPPSQVSQYLDSYVQQYGDSALIFASHDGFPQIVKGLLSTEELGYGDLINARDDAGNTAILYAAAKGFRQCVAALLRAGADANMPNQGGGGRTPLMEAAGGGFRDIVMALRLAPNMTSIDRVDDYGNTALHYAAYHGHMSAVLELLKSNPAKELKNNYGQTPASYAAANRHKGVSDVLSRSSSRSQRKPKEEELLDEHLKIASLAGKHVKGMAEELHKRDVDDFAPAAEKHMSETEQKALEEQLSRLKRQHEDAELKSQKRIVELMEKSAELQRTVDKAEHEARSLRYNNTDMAFKISDLEAKLRSSELHAHEEEQRAKTLKADVRRMQDEADRQRKEAESVGREHEGHIEDTRRQEEKVRLLQKEMEQQEDRSKKQQSDLQDYRNKIAKSDEEHRRQQDEIDRLQHELHRLRGDTGDAAASTSSGEATLDVASAPAKGKAVSEESTMPPIAGHYET